MTEEQINIAIAEACGYKKHEEFYRWRDPQTKELLCWKSLPDYCNDLNAMHEAEKVLTSEQIDKYVTILCLEIQPEPKLHHATARQRAEAFLKTIGKWEGGPAVSEWETFCDRSYYDLWRVRRKNERGFNDGYHIHNGDEARALVELLNGLERERDEARERADTMFAKHAEILDQYRRERDSERALMDRLSDALRELCHTFFWKSDITEESLNKAERVMADWVIAFVHRDQYEGKLIDSDCDCTEGEYLEPIDAAHATASQRAEAFLKTINKWKEQN